MGRLWRVEKSWIVLKIQNTFSHDKLVELKPTNIQSMTDWMDFVKEKKSARFKVIHYYIKFIRLCSLSSDSFICSYTFIL